MSLLKYGDYDNLDTTSFEIIPGQSFYISFKFSMTYYATLRSMNGSSRTSGYLSITIDDLEWFPSSTQGSIHHFVLLYTNGILYLHDKDISASTYRVSTPKQVDIPDLTFTINYPDKLNNVIFKPLRYNSIYPIENITPIYGTIQGIQGNKGPSGRNGITPSRTIGLPGIQGPPGLMGKKGRPGPLGMIKRQGIHQHGLSVYYRGYSTVLSSGIVNFTPTSYNGIYVKDGLFDVITPGLYEISINSREIITMTNQGTFNVNGTFMRDLYPGTKFYFSSASAGLVKISIKCLDYKYHRDIYLSSYTTNTPATAKLSCFRNKRVSNGFTIIDDFTWTPKTTNYYKINPTITSSQNSSISLISSTDGTIWSSSSLTDVIPTLLLKAGTNYHFIISPPISIDIVQMEITQTESPNSTINHFINPTVNTTIGITNHVNVASNYLQLYDMAVNNIISNGDTMSFMLNVSFYFRGNNITANRTIYIKDIDFYHGGYSIHDGGQYSIGVFGNANVKILIKMGTTITFYIYIRGTNIWLSGMFTLNNTSFACDEINPYSLIETQISASGEFISNSLIITKDTNIINITPIFETTITECKRLGDVLIFNLSIYNTITINNTIYAIMGNGVIKYDIANNRTVNSPYIIKFNLNDGSDIILIPITSKDIVSSSWNNNVLTMNMVSSVSTHGVGLSYDFSLSATFPVFNEKIYSESLRTSKSGVSINNKRKLTVNANGMIYDGPMYGTIIPYPNNDIYTSLNGDILTIEAPGKIPISLIYSPDINMILYPNQITGTLFLSTSTHYRQYHSASHTSPITTTINSINGAINISMTSKTEICYFSGALQGPTQFELNNIIVSSQGNPFNNDFRLNISNLVWNNVNIQGSAKRHLSLNQISHSVYSVNYGYAIVDVVYALGQFNSSIFHALSVREDSNLTLRFMMSISADSIS